MKKILSLILSLTLAAFILGACQKTSAPLTSEQATPEPLKIVASFYPIYDFSSKVVGEAGTVQTIVPASMEPHEYEPTPREIQAIHQADVFIYNGAGVDSWVNSLLPDLKNEGVQVVNLSESVEVMDADKALEQEEELSYDPHFWLDPVLAQNQIKAIRDSFIQIDPENKTLFEENAKKTLDALVQLDTDYQTSLTNCLQEYSITTHNAFRYLSNRYHLNLLAISGLSPEEEPSARALSNLINLAKEKQIHYVFFESLASPKLSETLATEIGAQTLVLNPIEGLSDEDIKNGLDYFAVMRENLKNLKTALECQ